MKKLIVANWKMNVPGLAGWRNFRAPKNVEVVVCPPDVYLQSVKERLHKSVKLGAQDVFWAERGAYTGEISPTELKNFGVEYVLVGHSEKRKWDKETDETVNKKVLASLKFGLKPILCVGEPLAVHKKGIAAAKRFVRSQLEKDLKGLLPTVYRLPRANLVIAYEPVWAIGTGRADKPEGAAEMAGYIKNLLSTAYRLPHPKVLYGGSVDGKNIGKFVKFKEMNGALVGGASLKINEFKKIINAIRKISILRSRATAEDGRISSELSE
jgi:triosephosphate isomerase